MDDVVWCGMADLKQVVSGSGHSCLAEAFNTGADTGFRAGASAMAYEIILRILKDHAGDDPKGAYERAQEVLKIAGIDTPEQVQETVQHLVDTVNNTDQRKR